MDDYLHSGRCEGFVFSIVGPSPSNMSFCETPMYRACVTRDKFDGILFANAFTAAFRFIERKLYYNCDTWELRCHLPGRTFKASTVAATVEKLFPDSRFPVLGVEQAKEVSYMAWMIFVRL